MAVVLKCSNPQCARTIRHEGTWTDRPHRCATCGWTLLDDVEPPTKTPHPSKPNGPSPATRFGRYQIVGALGEGGMGSVHLARDTMLERNVALKIPLLEVERTSRAEILARFAREARAAAAIQHPNVCAIHDFGEVDGVPFIAMAYIDGITLGDLMERRKVFSPKEAVSCVRRLAAGLEFGHRQGIVHRDLKPPNVMITKAGEPILLDFGIARRMADGDGSLTATGTILGTPYYMAPEQVEGDKSKIGPAVDVYSLGVILYQMLTGHRPFDGPVTKVLVKILVDEPRPPIELRPEIPPALSDVCLKALSKRPSDRYPSMEAFSQALKASLKGTAPAKSPAARTAAPKPRKTSPTKTPPAPVAAPAPVVAPPRRRGAGGGGLKVALILLIAGLTAAGALASQRPDLLARLVAAFKTSPEPPDPDDSEPAPEPPAKFFGLTDPGTKIAYVVDACRLLEDKEKHDFPAVLQELRADLEASTPRHLVNVFFCSNRIERLAWDEGDDNWKAATPEEVASILKHLATLAPGGKTPLGAQLAEALKLEPDAIFLLTPDEDLTPDDLLEIEPLLNGRTRIHFVQIASHERSGTKSKLEELADRTQGRFRVFPQGRLSGKGSTRKKAAPKSLD